jgi:adenine-specific DNA-methyltransferase
MPRDFHRTLLEPRDAAARIGARFESANQATIFPGDRLELLRQIPDEAAMLVVTSPPYNIGKRYERQLSIDQYLEEQDRTIAECVRILNPRGSICWQVGNHAC